MQIKCAIEKLGKGRRIHFVKNRYKLKNCRSFERNSNQIFMEYNYERRQARVKKIKRKTKSRRLEFKIKSPK